MHVACAYFSVVSEATAAKQAVGGADAELRGVLLTKGTELVDGVKLPSSCH